MSGAAKGSGATPDPSDAQGTGKRPTTNRTDHFGSQQGLPDEMAAYDPFARTDDAPSRTLSPEDAKLIAASGISQAVADARGYETLTDRGQLVALGYTRNQCIVPTLLVPMFGPTGKRVGEQHRPATPRRGKDDKVVKYETRTGAPPRVDCHPFITERLQDPGVRLILTEGARKADAAISAGLCCVSIPGVWSWKRDGSPLPDWDAIAMDGREVYVAFDSDVMTKGSVEHALAEMTVFLMGRGATVRWIYLPESLSEDPFGDKVGLDDYLAAGHTADDLLALARVPDLPVFVGMDVYANTEAALLALDLKNNPPLLFQRSDAMVEARSGGTTSEVRRERLTLLAARHVKWRKYVDGNVVPAKVPTDVVGLMLAAWDIWPFPVLGRVVTVPVFGADGSLRTEPGYERTSRILYAPPPTLMVPAVSSHPSNREVKRALALLMEDLLGDFPFDTDASRAHALGLVLQPFARGLIRGQTPLYFVDAPTQGTGKTKLVQSALAPAHGAVDSIAEPHSDEELEKRITAAHIMAQPVIFIDNVVHAVKYPSLASALTKEKWTGRKLGESTGISVPITCTWAMTGNGVTLSDDFKRRTALIRLDAQVESPHKRTGFKHSLPGWAYANHGELVWAACTLIQAWIARGRPQPADEVPLLGGFGPWRRVLGGITTVLGVPGFLGNLSQVEDASTESIAFAVLAEQVVRTIGLDKPFNSSNIIDLVKDDTEIMAGISVGRNVAQSIGMYLTQRADRITGHLQLKRLPRTSTGGSRYMFVRAPSAKRP